MANRSYDLLYKSAYDYLCSLNEGVPEEQGDGSIKLCFATGELGYSAHAMINGKVIHVRVEKNFKLLTMIKIDLRPSPPQIAVEPRVLKKVLTEIVDDLTPGLHATPIKKAGQHIIFKT